MAEEHAQYPKALALKVTAFNVGMIQADAHTSKNQQEEKIKTLAELVKEWLREGNAVVGLNEIHLSIAEKLVEQLQHRDVEVEKAFNDTDCLLWQKSCFEKVEDSPEETVHYIPPDNPNKYHKDICARTYLQVYLQAKQPQMRLAPVWALVLSHIKVGNKQPKGQDRS